MITTHEDFETILNRRVADCKAMLLTKGAVYSPNADRLENFRRAAALEKITNEDAVLGMMSKHIIALVDFITLLREDKLTSYAEWVEKLTDTHNYLYFIEAFINERFAFLEEK